MLESLRSPLARRLATLFVVASILPLTGAGYWIFRDIERTTRSDSAKRQGAFARAAAEIVRQWIARSSQQLALAGNPGKRQTGQLLQNLQHLVDGPAQFLEINQIADALENPRLVGQRAQTEFLAAQKSLGDVAKQRAQEFSSNVQIVRDVATSKRNFQSKQPRQRAGFRSLPISTPYESKSGQPGALVGYLDMRRLDDLLTPLSADGREVTIENADGKPIARAGKKVHDAIEHSAPVGYSDWRVRIGEDRSVSEASMRRARMRALAGLALALIISCIASLFFASRILEPVRTLTKSAARLEAGDLGARSGIDRPDEIGKLGRSFDAMAAALQRLDEAKSSFAATVSHELRTPLTSLRLSVANLVDGVVGKLSSEQEHVLQRIGRDTDRLIARVSDLLALAKLDAGVEQTKLTNCDLREIAQACCTALQALANERRVQLSVSGSGSAMADRGMVERIVTNLVDNAIKYGPEGGTIEIQVHPNSLRVLDEGKGIRDPKLVEAFEQGERAGVKHAGVGLGLAIVRRLAILMGARLRIAPGETSRIHVDFPATNSPAHEAEQ